MCTVMVMHTIQQAIADEVRAARSRRRMKQVDVCKHIGLAQYAYSRRENGETAFTGPELLVLAGVLGVDVADFYPEAPAEFLQAS